LYVLVIRPTKTMYLLDIARRSDWMFFEYGICTYTRKADNQKHASIGYDVVQNGCFPLLQSFIFARLIFVIRTSEPGDQMLTVAFVHWLLYKSSYGRKVNPSFVEY